MIVPSDEPCSDCPYQPDLGCRLLAVPGSAALGDGGPGLCEMPRSKKPVSVSSVPRLRLESEPSRRTLLDGGWWPRSANPVEEIPGLVLAIDDRCGRVTRLTLGPALNFAPDRPVRIAVSVDSEAPQVLTIVARGYNAANGNRDWEQSVSDNARYITSKHQIAAPGYHTFKVWMVDPGVVLERILLDTPASAKAASYLGPPESFRGTKR